MERTATDYCVVVQVTYRELEERLAQMEEEHLSYVQQAEAVGDSPPKPKKEVRIWMDGAFDVMHYGHMNAFRQGRQVGTWLVVGVNTDQSIMQVSFSECPLSGSHSLGLG